MMAVVAAGVTTDDGPPGAFDVAIGDFRECDE